MFRGLGLVPLREYNKIEKDFETLSKSYDLLKDSNKILILQNIEMEDELDLLKEDPEQYIEKEVEKRLMELEEELSEKIKHKFKNIGRANAYSEMGIWNIEAHKRGNVLVMLEDGSVVELLDGLEDVSPEEAETESKDGIKIDDIAEDWRLP